MTQSPRYRKCTPALWRGLCGMPLALRLNEGLGITRVYKQLGQSFASCGFCGSLVKGVGIFRIAKVPVHFLRHVRLGRIVRIATVIGSVLVAQPVVAKSDALVATEKRSEVVDSKGNGGVILMRPSMNQINATSQAQGVKACDDFIDRGAEVPGSGGESVFLRSGCVPKMNDVSDQNRAKDSDDGGDNWYWYVQFPAGVGLLMWAAGCLTGGRRHSGDL